jgi:hypothetical protein
MFTYRHENAKTQTSKNALWGSRRHAASFVTKECAASLPWEPMILISCQS